MDNDSDGDCDKECISYSLNIYKIKKNYYEIKSDNIFFIKSIIHSIPYSTLIISRENEEIIYSAVIYSLERIKPVSYKEVENINVKNIIKQQKYLEMNKMTMINMKFIHLYLVGDLLICLNINNITNIKKGHEHKSFYLLFGEFCIQYLITKEGYEKIKETTKYGSFIRRLIMKDEKKREMILI
jgi:hypothetical protein